MKDIEKIYDCNSYRGTNNECSQERMDRRDDEILELGFAKPKEKCWADRRTRYPTRQKVMGKRRFKIPLISSSFEPEESPYCQHT